MSRWIGIVKSVLLLAMLFLIVMQSRQLRAARQLVDDALASAKYANDLSERANQVSSAYRDENGKLLDDLEQCVRLHR